MTIQVAVTIAVKQASLIGNSSARSRPSIVVGDQQWLVHLFETEARSLVRLARFFVDDRDAAEDLVQEAFIRLGRSVHRLNESGKAPAYLRSIVLNLARDHNRRGLMSLRHQLPGNREVDVDLASVESDVMRHEGQRAVVRAVRALPRRQQACIVLRYYEDLSIHEIADILGVSPNSVKTHLRRALAALQPALADSATPAVGS